MKDAHWVISRLGKVVHDTDITLGNDGCSHYSAGEKFLINHLRAGKCKKDPTGFDLFQGLRIQSFVTHHGMVACIAVFCEGRGIEDDDIVNIFFVLQEIENIGDKGGM